MKSALLKITLIALGFFAIFGLSRFLENNKTVLPEEVAEEDLFFKGETLKKASLGFDGLIADYYWMQALQYIGAKIVKQEGEIMLDDLRSLNPRLLYPMLDNATTLDPDFTAAYEYGSVVLPAIDIDQAIRISEKGINAQPDNWQMYHRLGFIYWRAGNYQKAAEVYALGAEKTGAPPFMKIMSVKMRAEGSSRDVARQIYQHNYDEAQDAQTKEIAALRLLQLESLDERDIIKTALAEFQQKNNRCANAWRELLPILRTKKLPSGRALNFSADGAPVDPTSAPYLLQSDKCEVSLDYGKTKIPSI